VKLKTDWRYLGYEPYYDIYQEKDPKFSDKVMFAAENKA